MKNNELMTYYNILTDAWKIIKKHHDVEHINWKEVVKDTKQLYHAYDSKFAKKIALEVMYELERLEKEDKKDD